MHPREGSLAERAGRKHLREQVPDPELRAKLTPRYRIGCKRTLISNDYYPALQHPNVEVVTDSIAAVTRTGSSPPTASSARWTRSSSGPGST